MEGVILKGIGGFYTVRDSLGVTYTLRAQSKLRRRHLTPMTGDRVEFILGGGDGDDNWLSGIKPRRNSLIRPPVANIDFLVLTVAAVAPKADLMLIDRLILLCAENDISVILAVNKSDQDGDAVGGIAKQYDSVFPVYEVSAKDGVGINALRGRLAGSVHAFAGQSGVGKSSLINALYGMELETGVLSDKIERGKNTTRRAELIPVEGGGMVLDTPGFSLLETGVMPPEKLKELYPEFVPYEGQCRFNPCFHYKEPDCAVREAVKNNAINALRYERYQALLEDMRERWKDRYD